MADILRFANKLGLISCQDQNLSNFQRKFMIYFLYRNGGANYPLID